MTWILVAFVGGFSLGACAAGWWFGDTSARLVAYLALKHNFALPTREELRKAARLKP